jgi:Zn-dependent protease
VVRDNDGEQRDRALETQGELPATTTTTTVTAEAPSPTPAEPLREERALASAVDADEADFLSVRAALQAPPGEKKPNTMGLLMLSLLGFGWMANGHTTVASLAAFLLVLAANQLGHSFAMRGFGYRDRSVFFIPFFGSVAAGTKEDATPNQRAFVLLAGPLPGLVAGTVLSLTAARGLPKEHFLSMLTMNALVLNLIQLLPFPVFTGGQLAQLLLFRRHRLVEFAFRVVMGVALVAAAASFDLWVLAAIGVLSLYRLTGAWPIRKAADEIRARFGAISARAQELPDVILRALHRHAAAIAPTRGAVRGAHAQVPVAKEIHRLASEESPDLGTTMAILSVTSVLFIVATLAFIFFAGRGGA